jgi:Tubulin folding cofactor D C terminal
MRCILSNVLFPDYCILCSFLPMSTTVFLRMFDENRGRRRVIVPLLKTIEMLIDRLCLDKLISQTSFNLTLLEKLQEEVSQTSDVPFIIAILNVGCCLISPNSATQKEAISLVCGLLKHEFPRIRRLTAEKLYVRLLETNIDCKSNILEVNDEHPLGKIDIDMLLNHRWEADINDRDTWHE